MADRRLWRGSVWSDESVDNGRVLLLRDPHDLDGSPVVIRALPSPRRPRLARVEHSHKGSEGRVHPELARQLGAREERFEAEWRRASWYDVLSQNRTAVALILLTAVATAAAAALALNETAKEVGWGIAALLLIIGIGTVLLTARREWNELKP